MAAQAPVSRSGGWREAIDTQMGIWRWERTQMGRDWLKGQYGINAHDRTDPGLLKLLSTMYTSEPARILSGDPIYVTEEMCELVAHAAESFEPEPLLPSDLLVPFGFMLYEKPFPIIDRFGTPIELAAVSWGPVMGDEEGIEDAYGGDPHMEVTEDLVGFESRWRSHGAGVILTLYSIPKPDPPAWLPHFGPMPPAIPMHMTPWYFNLTFQGDEEDEFGMPTGAIMWWKLVQTTFRLMQQTLSTRQRERPERSQRREAARIGMREREVVVVRLRREKKDYEPSGEEAHYSHRFIVNSFWRNQWYPSINAHRRIWIAPYVKGPKDKELVIKPRRFIWSR